jgi:hypothetical protein
MAIACLRLCTLPPCRRVRSWRGRVCSDASRDGPSHPSHAAIRRIGYDSIAASLLDLINSRPIRAPCTRPSTEHDVVVTLTQSDRIWGSDFFSGPRPRHDGCCEPAKERGADLDGHRARRCRDVQPRRRDFRPTQHPKDRGRELEKRVGWYDRKAREARSKRHRRSVAHERNQGWRRCSDARKRRLDTTGAIGSHPR